MGTCAPKKLDSGKKMAAGKKKQLHTIAKVLPGGIAEEMGLEPGDSILSINGTEMEDIFDYQFFTLTDYLVLTVLRGGEEWEYEIENEDENTFRFPNERGQEGKIKIIKKWEDGLTGEDAENREMPIININLHQQIYEHNFYAFDDY